MKTIMVIDDEFPIIELLSAVLEEEGYEVLTASNGQEGLVCLEQTRPDLVLCDLMMPILDGREMCRLMQANPRYASIPVVLMSAVGPALRRTDCNYAALLPKPFELDDVVNIVASFTADQ